MRPMGIAQIVSDKTDAEVRMRDINWNAIGGGIQGDYANHLIACSVTCRGP